MSTNDPDPLRPPSSQAPDYTLNLSTSPPHLSTSSQVPQYLSNSPQETRYSTSPLDTQHPTHCQRLANSPHDTRYSTSPLDTRYPSSYDQRLANSPQETRHSTSPLDTRHLFHDQRLSASPTAAELYIHGEPFPELPNYPLHTVDPSIHIQQPSNEQDELSQMPTSQPSSFAPFFTLITDSTALIEEKDGNPQTPTTHHPSKIHYIFSDDEDNEALKDACLRSIPNVSTPPNNSSFMNNSSEELRASNSSVRTGLSTRKGSGKDGEGKRREERVILIDMNETGDRVIRAQSLSDKWQVMGCEIGKAPIWESAGEESGGNKEKGGGLMLTIDGVGMPIFKEDTNLNKSREKGKGTEIDDFDEDIEELDMDKILEGFDKKMGILRKVIGGVGWDQGHGVDDHGMSNMDGEGEEDIAIPGPETEGESLHKEREREREAFEAS